MRLSLTAIAVVFACLPSLADGPADNVPDNVRRIPPPGIAVPEADRSELEAGVRKLGSEIESLRTELKGKPALLDLLPDVQIYHNAVRYALTYNEFFSAREIPVAKTLLAQGLERAQALREGRAPWTTQTGLVARGYLSKIDGSVQPYGLVVPITYHADGPTKHRLDIWFHGRGETLSEVNFINDRQRNPGEFTPPNAFVLHPYGRYCNANKFAGEIDTFEALDHVRKHYPIDENRVSVRGFSMGGAACWQFAVHYASDWAAAAPGAGFSETADFLKVFQSEDVKPTWYEQKLWHMYDCTDYALNLFNCPTVAYSGEIDRQKQAADMMAKALTAEGMELVHIIGPKTAHSYEPGAKREVSRRVDSIVERGRNPVPPVVHFTTWTLRYNRMFWVQIDGLDKHWDRARVDADLIDIGALRARAASAAQKIPPELAEISLRTKNVNALTLHFDSGQCPLDVTQRPTVMLDGTPVQGPAVQSDRSWIAHFRKRQGKWEAAPAVHDGSLQKIPGLQGPIDDAFMDSFLMVRPTGTAMNDKVGAWAAKEMEHAVTHWRQQFRGDARVKDDTAITDEDIANSNLVLWGDPSSNKLLARIVDKLPIRWDAQGVRVGNQTYAAGTSVPVLIYPNPLNPNRYVILNSGFTYREYDYLNNARQVPKLPDWAVVDITTPPNSRWPGRIADAGFFDEQWRLTDKH
jgi:pimeloyl-ACP methyl ester carboxylesterase